jgi:hypothetical protein
MMLTVLSMLKANKWKTEFSLKGDLPAFEDEDANVIGLRTAVGSVDAPG